MTTNNEVLEKDLKARERDLVFGVFLLLSSIALGFYAHNISIKIMRIMDAKYYTAPGFLILIISVGLLIMSVSLIVHSLKSGARFAWLMPRNLIERFRNDKMWQTIIVFFYLFLYMVVFWDKIIFTKIRVPFWLNTLIFMNLLMFTFKAAKPLVIILTSLITSFSVYFIFVYLIGIPLP